MQDTTTCFGLVNGPSSGCPSTTGMTHLKNKGFIFLEHNLLTDRKQPSVVNSKTGMNRLKISSAGQACIHPFKNPAFIFLECKMLYRSIEKINL
jgi:hypothetical protein